MTNRTYNSADMARMQREAIRQARQMQSKAQKDNKAKDSALPQKEKEKEQNSPSSSVKPNQTFLETLGIDGEQAIIFLIIMLLMHEGADNKLILALCYILM